MTMRFINNITIAAFALSACNQWDHPNPAACDGFIDWSVELSRADGAPHEGAEGAAARAVDGSIVVAFRDPFQDVVFGTERLAGGNVGRISADGVILGHAPAPEGDDSHTAGKVIAARDGTFVVAWAGFMSVTLASYDADLHKRWSLPVAGFGFMIAMDVGANGDIAFVQSVQSQTGNTSALLYIGADGTMRWKLPLVDNMSIDHVRMSDGGDVFAFGSTTTGVHRWRYAAADGALVDDIPIPRLPDLVAPDGSFAFANYAFDLPSSARIEKYDAASNLVWSKTFTVRSYNLPLFTATGDIAALVSYDDPPTFSLLVLDGATGEKRAEAPACGYITPIWVDVDQYLGIGNPGSPSVGVASFPMPASR